MTDKDDLSFDYVSAEFDRHHRETKYMKDMVKIEETLMSMYNSCDQKTTQDVEEGLMRIYDIIGYTTTQYQDKMRGLESYKILTKLYKEMDLTEYPTRFTSLFLKNVKNCLPTEVTVELVPKRFEASEGFHIEVKSLIFTYKEDSDG